MNTPTSIIAYLEDDHRRIEALLAQAIAGGAFDERAYDALRGALLRHIAIEEKLLLSAVFRATGGEPIERAHELRIDHAALTSLLVPTPDLALCHEIGALLAAHDAKEEGPDGVYLECETRLGEAGSGALVERALTYPPIRLASHFDGRGTVRTADEALASARRIKPTKRAAGTISST